MKILALDPGNRVGWARADVCADRSLTDFRHGITPLRDMAMAVDRSAGEYDLIVFEDWRLYPHMAKEMRGSTFPSVQFIGMVKLAAWRAGTALATQGASIKKIADARMKVEAPDLHELVTRKVTHDDGHDQDAIRHLYYWVWKNGGADETHARGA